MNYKIIGNDGKIYGPAGAEQICAWIAQGRADMRTPVFVEGASDWTYLGMRPEFAPKTPAPPLAAPVPPGVKTEPRTNSFATAGFVCGLLAWVCCCGCPFNVFGLIFSLIALSQINASPENQTGRGLALAGLICSAVSLLFSLVLGWFQFALHPATILWHLGRI